MASMTSNLRQELADMVGPAAWHWLKPHASRDAVVIVNPQLDLVDVALALATDDVQAVQRWIGEQLITKPSLAQLEGWTGDHSKCLNSLIVQPYVLVQESDHAAP